ncbi:TetR/AcrR family transcriptional regulator [Streptomyces corynorhini]|uniref:TetR/AcrR family transcriptional regulator n=1 Tax=Streptomyces corynorhini TaxID=2282652 RepID=A0A370BC92_9ACTN|nr:TetR/AcrR family transcriptional regulator [Streptomyces corynorhini]RDG37999.1 TetR/AcrR family transcriptional regulator [Streptomyces corynorhini]
MPSRDETRRRVIEVASRLLADGGPSAVTTRAVCAGSGIQAPTLYRLFGDMDGLFKAVAADGFERYLADKSELKRHADPVDDLRAGWDLHVGFGLENPGHYLIMFGGARPEAPIPAAKSALDILRGLIQRIAEAGKLAVPVPLAAEMTHAAALGATLSLLGSPAEAHEPGLSVRLRESVIAGIVADVPADVAEPAPRATALAAVLDHAPTELTPGERLLLDELLSRLATRTSPTVAGESAP